VCDCQKIKLKMQGQKLKDFQEIMNALKHEKDMIYHIKSILSRDPQTTPSATSSHTNSQTSTDENAQKANKESVPTVDPTSQTLRSCCGVSIRFASHVFAQCQTTSKRSET